MQPLVQALAAKQTPSSRELEALSTRQPMAVLTAIPFQSLVVQMAYFTCVLPISFQPQES